MNPIFVDSSKQRPMYMQIYDYFKREIESGKMCFAEKLPSIRGLAKELSISKITVEKAYDQLLSEGYIENADRSRYTVAHLEQMEIPLRTDFTPQVMLGNASGNVNGRAIRHANGLEAASDISGVRYDFSSGEMDPGGFDFSLWKRYLGKALTEAERLMRYGHAQGEYELRVQIARYIRQSRGVAATAEQIVIGPGVQSLLATLCSILKKDYRSIAFEDPGFKNGRRVFADHDYKIVPISMQQDGIDIDALAQSAAKLVYVSPSHQFPTGMIMPIGKRNRLLSWVNAVDGLIIEDDYDSEFRYYGRPIPALKGLDMAERVIYLGSFSKFMPPSIRISYVVLPMELMERFHQGAGLYNQAASTTEQLALWRFMEDGHMERQIRRLRKRYQEKRQQFVAAIRKNFGNSAGIQDVGSGLFVIVDITTDKDVDELKQRARASGCRVSFMEEYSIGETSKLPTKRLPLYFSSIPQAEIETAVSLLRQAWID